MRWTCNLNGSPEQDPYGLSETAEEAQKRCLHNGQVATNLQIFSYNLEAALTLAPSDRVEVIQIMSGVRVPADKSWVMLQLCITDLEGCKEMGPWSLENWVALLVSIPTAHSFRELVVMRDSFRDEAVFGATMVAFVVNFSTSPVSELGVLDAIADPAGLQTVLVQIGAVRLQRMRDNLYKVKSRSILKSLVERADTEESIDAVYKAALPQLQSWSDEITEYNPKISDLLQVVIDHGSSALKRAIIDRAVQSWFSGYAANDEVSEIQCERTVMVLEWLCPLLDTYPTDIVSVDFPDDPETVFDWREFASDRLITLFGKGQMSRYNSAMTDNDIAAADAIREGVLHSVEMLLHFRDYIDTVQPLIVEYVPSEENIAALLKVAVPHSFLKRVSVDVIISLVVRDDLILPHKRARIDWDLVLKGFTREQIRRVKRAVHDSLPPNTELRHSPWIGGMRE